MSTPRRIAAVLLVSAMVGSFQVTGASPAAAMPGLAVVSATSVVDSSSARQVTAFCPVGKRITGVGAAVNGGNGEVLLTGYAPVHATADYGIAAAHEDLDGYAGKWSLTVFAFCANANPTLTIVSATSMMDSASNKLIVASCPAGKQTLGLGGWITGGSGGVNLNDLYPSNGLTTAHAWGFEVAGGYAGAWSVRAYAVCVAASPTLQEVYLSNPTAGFDTVAPKTVTVRCPPGKHVHGLGGRISGSLLHQTINIVQPNTSVETVTVKAYSDQFGQPQSWSLVGIALCEV